jgi:sugar phosphate isomerase/epimerase
VKLSVQQTLIPGVDLKERFQRAAEFGFNGVELTVWGFERPIADHFEEIDEAKRASGIAVSSICTSSADDLVHPEAVEREKRVTGLVRNLQMAEALGAGGVIALPIRPPVHLPDISPVGNETSLITQLLLTSLAEARAAVFLEPLNRYEARYLRTIGHAAELCEALGSSRVRIMADLFHMNIEEAHPGRALKQVGALVGHVHLADSQRLEPGTGHLDFVDVFQSLRAVGFANWLALECGLSGAANDALPTSVRYVRKCWDEAAD